MAAGVHKHLLPWEGDMDLQDYVDALRDVGFDGGLAFDIYDCDYAAVAGECISFLKKLIS
jgi:sugar phosphate isomerase/epimerase